MILRRSCLARLLLLLFFKQVFGLLLRVSRCHSEFKPSDNILLFVVFATFFKTMVLKPSVDKFCQVLKRPFQGFVIPRNRFAICRHCSLLFPDLPSCWVCQTIQRSDFLPLVQPAQLISHALIMCHYNEMNPLPPFINKSHQGIDQSNVAIFDTSIIHLVKNQYRCLCRRNSSHPMNEINQYIFFVLHIQLLGQVRNIWYTLLGAVDHQRLDFSSGCLKFDYDSTR
mmetsp:Transcript_18291/g.33169  ORF Transcript_18291/g.33169 Transcript_18291/m.33169 type:complete len:226 (-) Transcript_18291:373-1050(-)